MKKPSLAVLTGFLVPINFIAQQTAKYDWTYGMAALFKTVLGIELEQAYSGYHPHVKPFTGEGSFITHVIKGFWFPILFGLGVHKLADRLGINDELDDAGIPVVI